MKKICIAIPTLPNRLRKHFEPLYLKINNQIQDRKNIEIVSIIDNRSMSIGKKRSSLFNISTAKYTCIIDDDDDIAPNFIDILDKHITDDLNVDVVCYNQLASINGKKWIIDTNLNHNKVHPFDQLQVDQNGNPVVCKRPPWHWCLWKTEFVKSIPFGDSNCHEDAYFVNKAANIAKTQLKIDETLCYYNESQTPYNSNLNFDDIKPVTI